MSNTIEIYNKCLNSLWENMTNAEREKHEDTFCLLTNELDGLHDPSCGNNFLCGSCGEHCSAYTYNEDTDVDECNQCKTQNAS